MKSTEFAEYKARYYAAIRKVLAEAERGRLDEAGFPAYSHPNPVINWLFWQRLRRAMNHIEKQHEKILDFGCGSGVMLPFLAQHGRQVIAMDIDLEPLQRIQKNIPLAENVQVLNTNEISISQLAARSFDLIVALDVLEHVDDLPRTLSELINLLKPGGELVISGPTENIFYKLGRWMAGPEFSGVYHERGMGEIKKELIHFANIEPIATLFGPFPLFEIISARTK